MNNCEIDNCDSCKTRQKSVFSALGKIELPTLNDNRVCYKFSKGEHVFREGAYPNGLFCVQNGKLKVVRKCSDGKEKIVHLVKKGDIMGYRALLSGEKYSCSGVAIEESNLCFIPKLVFLGLIEKSHKLVVEVLHMLSVELSIAEKVITGLSSLPARQRITQSLLLLKENYGYQPDNCTIDITLSREEIANLSGTTRETAIRVLSDLDSEKIIELNAKKIKIFNHKRLVEIAEIYD